MILKFLREVVLDQAKEMKQILSTKKRFKNWILFFRQAQVKIDRQQLKNKEVVCR